MDIHKLIHCNFQQLDLLYPRKFSVHEGMFKVVNIRGFQETIHYLLMIIDPEKCAKVVQLPILNKKGESQFRVGVKTLLTEMREKHPEANLPNIFPSFLMQPGGEKFSYFMWKLTKFVLYRSLNERYGEGTALLPPRTRKGDPFAEEKKNLLCTLIHAQTQKALENQLKIDSATTQKCEWEYNLELNALDDEARKLERELSELIADAPLQQSLKDQLQNPNTREAAITEWEENVETEGRVLEAMVHALSKYANCLNELHDIISFAELHKSTQLCLDSEFVSIGSGDMKGSCTRKLSITSYLHSLNEMLAPMMSDLHKSLEGSVSLRMFTPALQEMRQSFQDIKASHVSMHTRLQEKLVQVQNSVGELVDSLPDEPSAASKETTPVPSSEDNQISPELSFTPVRGASRAYRDVFEDTEGATGGFIDPKLLLTPEIESSFVPVEKFKQKTCDTPLSRSTAKPAPMKPPVSSLRSLTSSLVKKKKWNELPQRSKSVSKLLLGSFQENSSVDDASGEFKDIFCSEIEDDDVMTSPSLLLASTSEELEQKFSKPTSRRSSLEAIIQRYHKVRSNMSSNIPKKTG